MELKYGKSKVNLDINGFKSLKILLPDEKEGLEEPFKGVEASLQFPIGTPPLRKMLENKKPEKIVIVVNDITRPTPYEYILPPLLDQLHNAGVKKEQITFIIATGIHEPHTEEQNVQIFGRDIVNDYRFISHDPDDNLVDLGTLPSGNSLLVNKNVAEADFVITTGLITPHYFATYSGGRKSILPGVCGRRTIQENHSLMVDLFDRDLPLADNPINLDMIDAARRVNVNFILNVVTNSRKEIVEVVAGELVKAWQQGVEISAGMYRVPVERKSDVTIVSAGGFPKDINMYQAQKALDNANKVTRDGGVILFLAECSMGLGEPTFAEWMEEAGEPRDIIDRITEEFVLGGHKAFAIARVVEDKEVILISDLDQKTTESLFFKKADSLEEGLKYIAAKKGQDCFEDCFMVIMPEGALTVPLVQHH